VVTGDRGQALTLEAITASLLLLAAVGFALQMTAVTPLSASTSSQHLENQLQATGESLLASAADTGTLKSAVLFWNQSEDGFHDSGEVTYYRTGQPPNEFGNLLNDTYGDRNIAYNVVIYYQNENGGMESQRMVFQGQPSDHAVSASQTIALVDDDTLVEADGSDGVALTAASDFFAPDVGVESGGNRPLYNLVRVEVIAWRI
jgi:hypothetical protein